MGNKRIVSFIIVIAIFLNISCKNTTKKYVIGCRRCGFFSNFIALLNSLDWAEKTGNKIAAYWDKVSLYYHKHGHNKVTRNGWEYYFEPLMAGVKCQKGDRILRIYSPTKDCLFRWFTQIDSTRRKRAKILIDKYIKIKPIIMKKINHFFNSYMRNKKTIGVYWRGTDKWREVRKVPQKKILEMAKKYATSKTQFLIASDEKSFINNAKKILGKKNIIYYDCYRSSNGKPIHGSNLFNKAQVGEDVLVEAILLSRCNILLFTYSNVSLAALCFNPQLIGLPVGTTKK